MNFKIKREYWIYGALMAMLLLVLEWTQYKYFVRDITTDALIGILAGIFILLGIWVGIHLTKRTHHSEKILGSDREKEALIARAREKYKLSSREVEVLELIVEGCSNKEIANRLFISLSTVKTHISNIYAKLEVKRRTQAVQKAKSSYLVH